MFRWLGSARRCVRHPLAAVLLVGALAACGSGGTGAGPADSSGGEFHARVTGKFGTTTIDRKPVRVVAMSWTDADLALSLGVTPVGIA
ncbi:MAG: iron-siderophore transport system substrate-binding protein, partial [Pseudonocardiales bacterium]|nr:iron-siderophore transport system substrate-binding protein [Pseudonocardiales bacterium]